MGCCFSVPTVVDDTSEKQNKQHPNNEQSVDEVSTPQSAKTFTYAELSAATKNLSKDFYLGEGGSGKVYKGNIDSINQTVAIKQLSPNGIQAKKEFIFEVELLSKLHHSNLVKMIGYCADGDQRLLVYEYMPFGSLSDHLHDLPVGKKPLDWNTRMRIAAGAAKGLEYLHDKADPQVIFGNLKSSDILLDKNFHPKLSVIGLAKHAPVGDHTYISTRVTGTCGFSPQEFAMTNQWTLEWDIFRFGVVLLEIITGKKEIVTSASGRHQNLAVWAKPMFEDKAKLAELADPALEGQYPVHALEKAISVAAMCVQEQDIARPVIADVVTTLSNLASEKHDPEARQIKSKGEP